MACASPGSDNDRWLSTMVTYEGAPLALRVRPDIATPDNRSRWQHVVAVTHTLAQVRSDGLPVASYNDTLAALDSAIVSLLDAEAKGAAVIIETISGERTYYSYATAQAAAERSLASVQAAFPGHELSMRTMPDSAWTLFDEYRRRFRF